GAAKPTLKPDIFKWLEGGHLNPGMTSLHRADRLRSQSDFTRMLAPVTGVTPCRRHIGQRSTIA
ncbi:hypothetical protein, partial [Burkholderia territorii]|uniref:hypothetical protein n=1 Tax=Burkholderia territorii TaxID=1503055 RepID=UPI001E613BED